MILFQGDCLTELEKVEDGSVSLVLSDLPYGTTKNDWDQKILLEPLWKHLLRVIKSNGVIAFWSQQPFSAELIMSQRRLFRYEWVIEKTNGTGFLNAKKMPLKTHENVLIFYRSLPTYNPQITHNHKRKTSTVKHKQNSKLSNNYGIQRPTTYDSTDRYPRDVLTFKWDKQKSRLHPTQKPVEACEYMIKTYTNPGETVLDCCMGSGSTGVAALNTGREFIGIELNPDYFSVAQERLFSVIKSAK